MSQPMRWISALLIIALVVGGPVWYHSQRSRSFRNFRVVEEGVLYRSGQLTLAELGQVLRQYGIKTVVSLRDGEKPNDLAEESFLRERGVHFVRIAPLSWWAESGPAPVEEGLAEFRNVMKDPNNHPVLVHCFAGIHRTGAYCAVFRMDFCGWPNAKAMKEMYNLGYRILDRHEDVRGFLTNYRPPQAAP